MNVLEGQVGMFGPDSWFGKTCQEHSPVEIRKDQILQRSLRKSSKSANRMPVCKCVFRETDGQNPDVITLRMEDGPLLGEYTMHSFGEFPREENASHLSQILVECADQKYYLTEKACTGILRRAAKRGKPLPEELRTALECVAHETKQNDPNR